MPFFFKNFQLKERNGKEVKSKMRVALFINTAGTYSQTDQILSDVVHYSGQRKRKTFDCWFAPEKQTEFFLFQRNPLRSSGSLRSSGPLRSSGWVFVGKARSECQILMRTANDPPVWVLKKVEANAVSEHSEPSERSKPGEASEANAVSEQSEPFEHSEPSEHSEPGEEEPFYISKEMVLKKCGLVSKYKSMATGIIPLE